ncbi:MAG TPA: (Fe-S)-binding protein [Sediminibacterium sp.]|uniref:(Fe-S)-binding protein n=1 Tax=Sediminibacterium sp. TaxID=1917865 RepID=UPI0008D3D3F2|nr:(Fe-S)-binding protein [Sediminibacterium sp.]MBT9483221.1 (Fe-S)-binding protein [Sediminibacterium sp.]OHC85338.1 MAG: Fe-S oxidoreductase [Sphingobacteriia bacterium RIFOXYC2_FULL_35_18]OHC89424.1 MAG: Fe-S oxidoreductase [Sphingobacteriia bacterium RIFOXYD2_FULL_35_12]HLD53633.1 (Fe-S)-binding protein [Sediminibacterium sp.]
MEYLQQALFVLMAISAIYLFAKKVGEIRRNIFLGKALDLSDNAAIRWKNLLLLAMGQKKMFKNIPVALMHFIIYAGFIIINIEVLEIVLDGILGTHRLFLPLLGGIYNWLINIFEVLALGVLVVCVLFLARRNWLKLKRLVSKDLNGWPKTDANFILITEIILMSLFLIMNATDQLLQQNGTEHYAATGSFSISSLLMPLFEGFSNSTLIGIERAAWWIHIAGIFAFLNYLPYSKHLHIALAFPNAYYAKLDSPGKINNMPEVQNEVLYAMQPELAPANAAPPASFGAKDVFDLSWKNLLDAYSCTECGRCTAECPANITGKLLSPRKIMMATRDRLEEVGKNINQNKSFIQDGKSLLHDYISVEELRACTTCNACVEACPVSISPLDIIVELRRSLIMEESNAPQEWNSTFSNIENNFAPWKFSPDDRDKWASEMAS